MASLGFGSLRTLIPLIVLVAATSQSEDEEAETVGWNVSYFGRCTAPCGGGLQVREVTCVRNMTWDGKIVTIKAEEWECPRPAPSKLQTCNDHKCLAEWAPQTWSECSKTCGLGSQTRQVLCESSMSTRLQLPGGTRHQVSESECGEPKPMTSRMCHVTDCPVAEELDKHAIEVENYTLWQLSRARHLKVDVGGELNLLPGQSVVLRCRVRHPALRELLYWSKDHKLVSFSKHLTIYRANPVEDAGTYTCTAQNDNANITIKFIENDNPVPESYKLWKRKARRRRRLRLLNETKATPKAVPTTTRSHNKRGANESSRTRNKSRRDQQRDQSRNGRRHGKISKKKQPTGPTFVAGAWSKCNATCGVRGQRSREVTCSRMTWKYAMVLPEDKCLRAGLAKPNTTRECFYAGRCAVWRPGPWTRCRPLCGRVGYKTRYLVCEWSDTRELAWNTCDQSKKPETSKPCKPKLCSKGCVDKSRSCNRVKYMGMCRYSTFKRQCCRSCQRKEDNSWRKTNSYWS